MSGAYQFLIGKLRSLHGGSATAIKTCNVGCSATSAKAPFCGLCRACGQSLHPVDHLSGLSQQRSGISAWCQTHRLYVRTAATMGSSPAASSRPTDIPTVRDVRNAPAFGPRGMLLVGFSKEQGKAARRWMRQMEPDFPISHCTATILDGTVEQAVATLQHLRRDEHQQLDEVLPRLVLLSGMSGEEAVAIAEHWEEYTGTPAPIFATLVDKLLNKPMRTAILDIIKAHVSGKKNDDSLADTAALRVMIRRKIQEKQKAGARLISRDGGQGASAKQQPIIIDSETLHHSQGLQADADDISSASSPAKAAPHTQAQQQQSQIAYAKKLLQAASAPKAPRAVKEKRKKASREKVVRKGFG